MSRTKSTVNCFKNHELFEAFWCLFQGIMSEKTELQIEDLSSSFESEWCEAIL